MITAISWLAMAALMGTPSERAGVSDLTERSTPPFDFVAMLEMDLALPHFASRDLAFQMFGTLTPEDAGGKTPDEQNSIGCTYGIWNAGGVTFRFGLKTYYDLLIRDADRNHLFHSIFPDADLAILGALGRLTER